MNYFLIGMPGSGKSTLGKGLAEELDLEFVDLDKIIEKNEGTKIKHIFAEKGEDYFRQLEKESLHSVVKNDNQLIATGGGAPCFFNNMDVIKKNGISIYLNVPAESIADRMMAKAKRLSKRPLIKSDNLEDLTNELKAKLNERDPYYKQASVVIDGPGITVEQVLEELKGL